MEQRCSGCYYIPLWPEGVSYHDIHYMGYSILLRIGTFVLEHAQFIP